MLTLSHCPTAAVLAVSLPKLCFHFKWKCLKSTQLQLVEDEELKIKIKIEVWSYWTVELHCTVKGAHSEKKNKYLDRIAAAFQNLSESECNIKVVEKYYV